MHSAINEEALDGMFDMITAVNMVAFETEPSDVQSFAEMVVNDFFFQSRSRPFAKGSADDLVQYFKERVVDRKYRVFNINSVLPGATGPLAEIAEGLVDRSICFVIAAMVRLIVFKASN